MNEIPRETLKQLIATYGISLCDNPMLCKSLLLDLCGEHRREINLLINALEEHVAIDLLNSSKGIPYELLRARIVKRLHENRGLDENYARWAVESWALALDFEETISPDVWLSEEPAAAPKTGASFNKKVVPGGEMSARPLHFIWIVDCSNSMHGDKIQALNTAIRESILQMRLVAANNPNVQILVRAIKFSTSAQWHIAQPTPLERFRWVDVPAGGKRDMGDALFKVAEQLDISIIESRACPPVLVLISDGYPSDDFESGFKALTTQLWGKKAVRLAIGIGSDAPYELLQRFIGNQDIKVIHASNLDNIMSYIKWADDTEVIGYPEVF